MNEIGQSDHFLFWLINLTITIEKLVSKATWLILAGALIAGVNLLVAKFFNPGASYGARVSSCIVR
jgi:hypothetical protein